jgi:hypothetical protein
MVYGYIRCSGILSRRPLVDNGHICVCVPICARVGEIDPVHYAMGARHKTEEIGSLDAPAALHPGKELSVLSRQEAGWSSLFSEFV